MRVDDCREFLFENYRLLFPKIKRTLRIRNRVSMNHRHKRSGKRIISSVRIIETSKFRPLPFDESFSALIPFGRHKIWMQVSSANDIRNEIMSVRLDAIVNGIPFYAEFRGEL